MKARMFEIKINLGNEAMQYPMQVYIALVRVAKQLRNLDAEFDGDYGSILDVNGNTVGSWGVK